MLDRLFELETFGIKLGLENITRLCAALDHPERAFKSLHVAGTNGKGSVTAMVHAALRAQNIRAARYTSPHLTDLSERFVIEDAPVDASALEAAVAAVLECADRLRARGVLHAPPTFFEATTATAFQLFRSAGVEVAVIEVGLGGRFDATNVIAPAAGAITTIAFDHQQHLGDTLEAIAFEKAGIIKPGMTVALGDLPQQALDVIRRVATDRGADLVETNSTVRHVADEDGRARVTIETGRHHYGPVSLGLRGAYQAQNAAVAVALIEAAQRQGIAVSPEAMERGLSTVAWPARLELLQVGGGGRVLLDAAHNVEGALALAEYLRAWHTTPAMFVLGAMRDKDVDGIIEALLPVASAVIATAAPTARAMPAAELAARVEAVATRRGGSRTPAIGYRDDPMAAVDEALRQDGFACVAGSIFLVGAVRDRLRPRAILQ